MSTDFRDGRYARRKDYPAIREAREYWCNSGLPPRCATALSSDGIFSRQELEEISREELKRIPELGPKGIAAIDKFLGNPEIDIGRLSRLHPSHRGFCELWMRRVGEENFWRLIAEVDAMASDETVGFSANVSGALTAVVRSYRAANSARKE